MRSTFYLLLCVLAAGLIAAGCGDDGDGGGASDEPVADECMQAVQSAPQLSAEVREELEGRCEEGARGGAEAAGAAARDVCIRVLEESLPDGPALNEAMESCSQGAQ